ncbi:Plasmodium exported protein, unknown function [Plasmodium relictum]|uniref:Uncharacterized protein n=1 Tax=Plasmodium relictum TaxID=85471 RepID=A0A1J1HDA2_PLARL|nr:Plasmodium exported protein, unknown function [Plasmodium relictum]CRH01563.1 Plasmodium exported protein, unknown function [Plasmodium relictum]
MEYFNIQKSNVFEKSWTFRIICVKKSSYFFGIQNKESKKNCSNNLLSKLLKYIYKSYGELPSRYQYSKRFLRKLAEKKINKSFNSSKKRAEENLDKLWENFMEKCRLNMFIANSNFLIQWISFCSQNNVNDELKNYFWGKWIEENTNRNTDKYNQDDCDYKKFKKIKCFSTRFNSFLREKHKSFKEFYTETLELWNKYIEESKEALKNTETLNIEKEKKME